MMNRKQWREILRARLPLLIALGVAALVGSIWIRRDATGLRVGSGAIPAEWTLKDLEGGTVRSSDLMGKVVILDFWATWCGPCLMEIPGFIELQKTYGEQGLVVVGIAVDEEGAKVVKPFVAQAGINYQVLIGDAKIQRAFGIEALPTTFILGRSGKVVKKHVGFTPKTEFENDIIPLLKS